MQEIKNEKTATELSALKAQINPHFLFNSLNSIYSLVLTKSKKAPEIVVRLSDILRHMLYNTQKDFISLEKEIENLKNYLELQKLRVDSRAKISFEIKGNTDNLEIVPLLFMPLVENSFKHGIKGEINHPFIQMELQIEKKHILFIISNNKGIIDDVENQAYSGIGLKNLQNRLEILYPRKHTFLVSENEDEFTVRLKIDVL